MTRLRTRVLRFAAPLSCATLLVVGCVDGPSAPKSHAASVALSLVLGTADQVAQTAPITRIRLSALAEPGGNTVAQGVFNVDPGASGWTLDLEMDRAQLPIVVRVLAELISVSGGVETVEYSALTDPIAVLAGSTSSAPSGEVVRGPPGNAFVTGVTASPPTAQVMEGAAVSVSSTVQASRTGVTTQVFWTSLDPSVATVSPASGTSATVQTLLPGTARIVATAGSFSDTVVVTVGARPAGVVISPTSVEVDQVPTEIQFSAHVVDPRGGEISGEAVTFSTSTPSVLEHVGGGTFRAVAGGTGVVRATSVSNATLFAEAQVSVTVVSGVGDLSGRVIHGVTGAPLQGATVVVDDGAGGGAPARVTASASTDSDGRFTFTDLPAGSYDVTASLSGFVTTTLHDAMVVADQTTALETIPLVPESGSSGTISGRIVNAVDATGIVGAQVLLLPGVNGTDGPVVGTAVSGSGGVYTISGIAAGTYTVTAQASGFAEGSRTGVVVGAQSVTGQDVVLSPIDGGGGDRVRVVLTWGASPSDLDSHMTGPLEAGGRFHVAYYASGSLTEPPFAALDTDDQSSFGPETITFIPLSSGVYRYAVHDYTNGGSTSSTALAGSGARVEVFQGSTLLAQYFVPAGGGTLWTVFEYEAGTITPVNTMSYDEPETLPAPGLAGGLPDKAGAGR